MDKKTIRLEDGSHLIIQRMNVFEKKTMKRLDALEAAETYVLTELFKKDNTSYEAFINNNRERRSLGFYNWVPMHSNIKDGEEAYKLLFTERNKRHLQTNAIYALQGFKPIKDEIDDPRLRLALLVNPEGVIVMYALLWFSILPTSNKWQVYTVMRVEKMWFSMNALMLGTGDYRQSQMLSGLMNYAQHVVPVDYVLIPRVSNDTESTELLARYGCKSKADGKGGKTAMCAVSAQAAELLPGGHKVWQSREEAIREEASRLEGAAELALISQGQVNESALLLSEDSVCFDTSLGATVPVKQCLADNDKLFFIYLHPEDPVVFCVSLLQLITQLNNKDLMQYECHENTRLARGGYNMTNYTNDTMYMQVPALNGQFFFHRNVLGAINSTFRVFYILPHGTPPKVVSRSISYHDLNHRDMARIEPCQKGSGFEVFEMRGCNDSNMCSASIMHRRSGLLR